MKLPLVHLSLVVTSLIALHSSHASVLVSDTFSGVPVTTPLPTSIIGTTPETSIEGRVWQRNGDVSWGVDSSDIQGDPTPSARVSADVGAFINIASGGAYVKPTTLTISADLFTTESAPPFLGGLGIGFLSSVSSGHGPEGFTGITLNPLTGTISLITGGAVLNTIAYSGTWDGNAWHSLSYTINTTSGAVTNLLVDGIAAGSFSNTPFSNLNTQYAGFMGSYENGGGHGYVDNFSLTSVPEPATAWLTVGAISALAILRRRRK